MLQSGRRVRPARQRPARRTRTTPRSTATRTSCTAARCSSCRIDGTGSSTDAGRGAGRRRPRRGRRRVRGHRRPGADQSVRRRARREAHPLRRQLLDRAARRRYFAENVAVPLADRTVARADVGDDHDVHQERSSSASPRSTAAPTSTASRGRSRCSPTTRPTAQYKAVVGRPREQAQGDRCEPSWTTSTTSSNIAHAASRRPHDRDAR